MSTPQKNYTILTASANMPLSCWGRYARIAVVELEPGFDGRPAMISERARGVSRIVETWERLHVGSTDRCAYARAMAAAEELLGTLEHGLATDQISLAA